MCETGKKFLDFGIFREVYMKKMYEIWEKIREIIVFEKIYQRYRSKCMNFSKSFVKVL